MSEVKVQVVLVDGWCILNVTLTFGDFIDGLEVQLYIDTEWLRQI